MYGNRSYQLQQSTAEQGLSVALVAALLPSTSVLDSLKAEMAMYEKFAVDLWRHEQASLFAPMNDPVRR